MLQRQGLDPYPALNWLTLATLLDEQVPDADALIERCEATADERFSIDRSFFTAVAFANVALVRALRSGRLGQDGQVGDQEVVQLQEHFQEIVNDTAPTASELDSVCMQIDIIEQVVQEDRAQTARARGQRLRASPSYAPGSGAMIETGRAPGLPAKISNPRVSN